MHTPDLDEVFLALTGDSEQAKEQAKELAKEQEGEAR